MKNKTAMIAFKVSEAEKEEIKRQARKDGFDNLSPWLLWVIRDTIKRK